MDLQTVLEYEAMVKLNLTETERAWISEKTTMLEHSFGALSNVDTEGIEPLVAVINLIDTLREDIPHKSISRDEILSNSPEQNDGYFQVPKTIE